MTNGIIIIDKPKNLTSRDVVNKVGKILNTKKVGHTGTLDPIATGVLVLTIGKATKISEILSSIQKEYIADAILGIETDTLDITGNITKEQIVSLKKEKIVETLKSFIGTYQQEVPIYSAVKINGKKLYEYARNNEKVDLPKKEVNIINIELLDYENEDGKVKIRFKALVSKGTYIRSLIRDIANRLGTFGIMSDLRRTKQGEYHIQNSYKIENIENNSYQIIPIREVFRNYKQIEIDEKLEKKIFNGMAIENIYNEEFVLFYKNDQYALYKKEKNLLIPYKMML